MDDDDDDDDDDDGDDDDDDDNDISTLSGVQYLRRGSADTHSVTPSVTVGYLRLLKRGRNYCGSEFTVRTPLTGSSQSAGVLRYIPVSMRHSAVVRCCVSLLAYHVHERIHRLDPFYACTCLATILILDPQHGKPAGDRCHGSIYTSQFTHQVFTAFCRIHTRAMTRLVNDVHAAST